MEYRAEDISPVKKKVVITTEPAEVEAAIMAAIAVYKNSTQWKGFRKGKVPASLVEQRYHDRIYQEARVDLVNVHVNSMLQEMKVMPLGRLTIDADGDFERGKPFSYTVEFEVLPTVDLPPYEGMEVEQERADVSEEDVDRAITRILRTKAVLEPVEGSAPPVDGQVVSLDFAAYEGDTPLENARAKNFDLLLGAKQALEDFEALVKTVPAGQEGEGAITFPEDFLDKDLAGKTVTMKVRVHAVRQPKIPALTDEVAKELHFENKEQLRSLMEKSCKRARADLCKSAAQRVLVERLLKMVEIPLPACLLESATQSLLSDWNARLERQGRNLSSLHKTEEQLKEEVRPQAEFMARTQALLLCIAKKEELDVSETELSTALLGISHSLGEDFHTLRAEYERTGMIFLLRDRLLADKAMDLVYAKAKVTEVEPGAATSSTPDTVAESGITDEK